MEWLEFSFSLDGQTQHVYSREEADALIAAGSLTPDTPVTLFLEGAKRRRVTADMLGLSFGPAAAAQAGPVTGAPPKLPTPVPEKPAHSQPEPKAKLSALGARATSAVRSVPSPKAPPTSPASAQPSAAAGPRPQRASPAQPPAPPPASKPAVPLIPLGIAAVALAFFIIFIWSRQPDTTEPTIAEPSPSITEATAPVERPAPPPANPAITAETEAAPAPQRDIPRSCRTWSSQPQQLDLCTAVQGQYARLQRAYANAAVGGATPEATLIQAINACGTRRCIERRLDARIADLRMPSAPPPMIPPAATMSPSTIDRSRPVRPRNQEATWIRGDDYPASAIREGAQGTVHVLLNIGADGRVASCGVTSSSGNAALDQATCRNMERRARFEPALDRDGNPVSSTYTKSVRWQLP